MKSDYFGIWLILLLSLCLFIGLSFSDDIKIGDWEVKKAHFKETLLTKKNTSPEETDTLPQSNIVEEIKIDSLPKNIFLFGDSMTLNIALRMAQYARQNGHKFHAVNWDSSNTKLWAQTDTLDFYLKEYKPDYIFISLGSNEVYFKDPTSRQPYVEKILRKIDTIPYVWIGPPNWNEDTGINKMLEKLCVKNAFFSSEGIELRRKSDHIHPTRSASVIWTDSLMRWLPKSHHPILMETPSDSLGKVKANIVILKALNS